jgi:hypothetical protein
MSYFSSLFLLLIPLVYVEQGLALPPLQLRESQPEGEPQGPHSQQVGKVPLKY